MDALLAFAPRYRIDVVIDTLAVDVAAARAVHARYPRDSWPAGTTVTAQLWSEEDLRAIARLDPARSRKVEHLHYFLSHVHRHWMHARALDYAHFAYLEDDAPLTLEAFEFYASRQRELWAHGYLFGFVRLETRADGAPVLTDSFSPVVDGTIFVAPSGARYVRLHTSYQGFWLLDREQFNAFVNEPRGQWVHGAPGMVHGARERVSFGWTYVPRERLPWFPPPAPASLPPMQELWSMLWPDSGDAFDSRVLSPLSDGVGALKLDVRASVVHLPNNYAHKGPIALTEALQWSRDAREFERPPSCAGQALPAVANCARRVHVSVRKKISAPHYKSPAPPRLACNLTPVPQSPPTRAAPARTLKLRRQREPSEAAPYLCRAPAAASSAPSTWSGRRA